VSPLIADVVGELARRCRERFGERVLDVRLFGSWARGEARADSDVDVFVLLEGADRQEERVLLDVAADIFTRRFVRLSPLVMSPERHAEMVEHDRRLVRDIDNEGLAL